VLEEMRRLERNAIVIGMIDELLDKAFVQVDINAAKRRMEEMANQAVKIVEMKEEVRKIIVKSVLDELLEMTCEKRTKLTTGALLATLKVTVISTIHSNQTVYYIQIFRLIQPDVLL